MNPNRIAPLLLIALLAGCGGQLKREISVSQDLRDVPVRSVFVFDPVFPDKIKRRNADDLGHMLPDRQAVTADRVRTAIVKALSASLTVESNVTLDAAARDWALQIGRDLCRGRVPLVVDPVDLPVESVLLTGIKRFGWENNQLQASFLWFEAKKKFGKPKYEHNVSLQTILVNPRTGAVLMDALDEQRQVVREGSGSDEVLDTVLAGVVAHVTGSFPEPPGGWKPAAAAPAPVSAPDGAAPSATPLADGIAPAPAASSTILR